MALAKSVSRGRHTKSDREDLQATIQTPGRQILSVDIVESSSDLEFIFFVNAMRYGLSGSNSVKVTGKDVWAVQVEKFSPSVNDSLTSLFVPSPESFAKPRPP